jgi:hypothetical protein
MIPGLPDWGAQRRPPEADLLPPAARAVIRERLEA